MRLLSGEPTALLRQNRRTDSMQRTLLTIPAYDLQIYIQKKPARIFDEGLHTAKEGDGLPSVDQPMVVR